MRRRRARRNPGGLGLGTWALIGLGLWALRRAGEAKAAGVTTKDALLAPFTPIPAIKAQLDAAKKPAGSAAAKAAAAALQPN